MLSYYRLPRHMQAMVRPFRAQVYLGFTSQKRRTDGPQGPPFHSVFFRLLPDVSLRSSLQLWWDSATNSSTSLGTGKVLEGCIWPLKAIILNPKGPVILRTTKAEGIRREAVLRTQTSCRRPVVCVILLCQALRNARAKLRFIALIATQPGVTIRQPRFPLTYAFVNHPERRAHDQISVYTCDD